ncbi:AP2-like ethylene-responsive transcription factor ANT [Senna tora]|uniref:AP2-like ethylene-responsive transcription factor ANT n=1 Tax=Senna tora TaxID=362788 RepID=A0A834WSM9_9FABA|nr:AP2-like ethylene-responsive transcription factor ANT [Senna tora]
MKSLNDSNNNDATGNANHHPNWLGFSLSPHMKMELTSPPPLHHHYHHHHQPQASASASTAPLAVSSSASVPTTFCLSPSHLTTSYGGICYASATDNSPFHSPLSVMPLKSDGSLCIMEALTRSQSQAMVPTSSPKLEDFLGGATMGAHDYGSSDRAAMALSLDSIYYSTQNAAETHDETHRDHSLDFLSEPFRNQQDHISLQSHPFYSGIAYHPLYQTPPMAEEGIACFKNWGVAPRDYSTQQTVEHKKNNGSMVDDSGASGSVGKVGCGDLQSLSLSVSPGSQSSCVTAPQQISPSGTDVVVAMDAKKRSAGKLGQKQPVHRKSIDTFGQRTSQYRGVTRHRWTGRYEAHLWDNSCKKEGQTRKGRQGGYDMEEKAARAYDLAALKYWGPSTHINFPLENYHVELEEMKNMSRQEYVAHLRRKSSGFSRGASMYRGVTRHHQHGRWQARIGRVAGNKDLYLGTFSTQEEAAEAYDIAAIKFRGVNAVTNFDISRYDVERIMASNTLLAGELARRNKEREPPRTSELAAAANMMMQSNNGEAVVQVQGQRNSNGENGSEWKMVYNESNNSSCDQKSSSINCGNYRNSAISMALHDLIGIDSAGSGQSLLEDTTSSKLGGTTHFSNPSSLVTSLSSSREASPDKSGPTLLFPKPPSSKMVGSPVSSWFPSAAQLRPGSAISMSHLPVFAAWNDT